MTRTSILSINDYINLFDNNSQLSTRLQNTFHNPQLKEALLIASKDLLEASTKNSLTTASKSSEQVRASLIKYFIRMSTRPTPFGLFSGISIGRFNDVTKITVSDPQNHTKRARPDMEWVYGVIKQIEANSKIRDNLMVRFNDFTHPNDSRIEKPNKTFMQLDEGNELSASIRYTNQVKMLEEKCIKYNSFTQILNDIIEQNPNVPVNRIQAFLSQLLENEFLLSELRPPLINTDMLDYLLCVLNKMEGIEEVDFYVSKLKQIQQNISAYNNTSIGNGIDIYNDTVQLQKELYECKNYLQVDMKMQTENNSLAHNLKEDLEHFASAMYRLAPIGKMSDEMTSYVELFLERYGDSCEVPVLELLDIDKGLGAPAHYQTNKVNRPISKRQKPEKEQRLNTLMNRKLVLALREGNKTIEITDEDIDYVCADETPKNEHSPMDAIQSFELYLLAHPGTHYNFTVAPAIASDGFGKSFGRFSDMLTQEELLSLTQGFNEQKSLFPEHIIAEIAEILPSGRTSNISLNNSDYDYQIALTTNPCENKHVLSVRDLYIGVDRPNNMFYVKSKSLDKKVIVTMTCMMNPTFGSSVLRFLREVSTARRTRIADSIINIVNTDYDYYPRVTYGKVIIKPETWLITTDALGKEKDKKILEEKFSLHRLKWSIPRFVFLSEFDNRLLIDLDNSCHRDIIYSALKKNTSMSVMLTELGCDFSDFAASNSKGEKYITEIVVPFTLSADSVIKDKKVDRKETTVLTTLSNITANRMAIERDPLMLLPGNNEWLYYKLYGCSKRQNELISVAYENLQKLVAEGFAQKYFFIRYSDPEPHLRIRVQPGEKGIAALFMHISQWLNSLYADGLVSKAVNDSYIRESERYGGSSLIKHAEDYFYHDSKLVMALLTIQRFGEAHLNMDLIGVSFIISALEAFGLSIEEQGLLLDSLNNNKNHRKEFQDKRRMIIDAVDSSDDWFSTRSSASNPEIYDWINENSIAVKKYANAVYEADRRGELTNSIEGIVLSVIHMFCNRLMGNNAWEQKIFALAKHGVHGLKGLLKSRRKEAFTLELPESLI